MAYTFTGFFSKAPELKKSALRDGHVFRRISEPFSGCGLYAPDLPPAKAEVAAYIEQLGLATQDWVFFHYQTWAGPVEHVTTFGQISGDGFGPTEKDGDAATAAFIDALTRFGATTGEGTYFAPFERGYWSET